MNLKNLFLIFVLICTILPAVFFEAPADAALEWEVTKTLEIDGIPVDIGLSPDGKKLYVLTDRGKILVYSDQKEPTDELEVGNEIDQVKVGPRGDVLILGSRQNKMIQIVSLDFIQNIDTSGSPYKGPADAPVVIAVFDDFQ